MPMTRASGVGCAAYLVMAAKRAATVPTSSNSCARKSGILPWRLASFLSTGLPAVFACESNTEPTSYAEWFVT